MPSSRVAKGPGNGPVLAHPASCLATTLQIQLSKKMVNMRFCGCHSYVQVARNVLVALDSVAHLGGLRLAPGERQWRGHVVGRSQIGKLTQQASNHAWGARLPASFYINQEWNNVGESGGFWNIPCNTSLSPGNNFLSSFGHSNHDNWSLRGNTLDLSNSCKTTWERLVKQHDVRLIIGNKKQGLLQVGEKVRD